MKGCGRDPAVTPAGCETGGLDGIADPPNRNPLCSGDSSPAPSCPPCPLPAWEGRGQNLGAWVPASLGPPCVDDVGPAGLTHTAICAQACARGWGPRGPRLPALEQMAPLQGVDRQVEPAWLVFGASCAGQVSGCAGVGPSCSMPGLAALVGRKLGPSSLPGPSCCHRGLFQKLPGTGHLVKGAT